MNFDLRQQFEQASRDAQALPRKPANIDLPQLNALYKQARQGDVSGARAGFLDQVGRAKCDAWASLRGIASEEAMQGYLDKVSALRGAG